MPENEAAGQRVSPWSLKQWLWFGIIIAGAFSALFLADNDLLNGRIEDAFGTEPFKLVLQFLLITVAGGLLVALIGARKEEDARRQARIEAIQTLDRELSEAYRLIKQSRRRLRSRCDEKMGSKKDGFESCMDELLAAQISLEQVEDNIEIRQLLIGDERYARVAPALHYAARYLHDVFEDFEKGKVGRAADGYEIGSSCINLKDFIEGSKETPYFKGKVSDLYDQYKKRGESLKRRQAILEEIVSLYEERKCQYKERKCQEQGYRYQKIAFECIRSVARELRMASRDHASRF